MKRGWYVLYDYIDNTVIFCGCVHVHDHQLEDSPFYVVSDIVICGDLYINSGSMLVFTGDYLLFVTGT